MKGIRHNDFKDMLFHLSRDKMDRQPMIVGSRNRRNQRQKIYTNEMSLTASQAGEIDQTIVIETKRTCQHTQPSEQVAEEDSWA
jgi:hypothetical protein